LTASVSSRLDGLAAVDRVIPDSPWLPVLDSCTARETVSLGTRPAAPIVRRLVAVPAAPRAMFTVPLASGWLALVLEVNVPNVPRPATAATPPSNATEASALLRVDRAETDMTNPSRDERGHRFRL